MRESRPGHSLDVAALTEECGLAALKLNPDDDWTCGQTIGLMLNAQAFWQAEHLPTAEPIASFALVAPDDLAEVILWLQARSRAPRICLFTDYSVEGLEQASKLLEAAPEATYYLAPNFREAWGALGDYRAFDPLRFDLIRARINVRHPSLLAVTRELHQRATGLRLDALTRLPEAAEEEI